MACQRHDHLPTPLIPATCEDCHPRDLRQLMGGGSIGTTSATSAFLSDSLATLRKELCQSQETSRQRAAMIDQLTAEVAGLKRGLSAAKRDLRRSRDDLTRARAETIAIVEAMERMNRPEDK